MGTLSLNDYEDVSIWVPWGHIAGRWYGNRKERPILAIHGFLDNLGSYDRLIPLLPDYLGVLCIDLPGHGYSSPLPPGIHYDFFDSAFLIARIMKEFKWSKVSLMGHSFGALLGFIYTSLAPHTVDLVISIEAVLSPMETPDFTETKKLRIEKYLEEEERNASAIIYEPTSYTLESLTDFVSKITFQSVPKEFAHHLLKRTICKSRLYPNKFYIAKDNRVKYFNELLFGPEFGAEMARRIGKKPFLIIKGCDSPFITEQSNEIISILGYQNPQFEFHEVSGLHHVHLSNATECAKYINPFLNQHRANSEEKAFSRKSHKL
ncbi:probable serine hydrolase [Drosophila innubila]|uniref:probable serine hydrolase n=1 Tax=Drosophila innubila TaxID=198719 RepID=UPI00148E8BC1|nr:probable serine hydrolase [Drosophila innubila]